MALGCSLQWRVELPSVEARVRVLDDAARAGLLDGAVRGEAHPAHLLQVQLRQPAAVRRHRRHARVRDHLAAAQTQFPQRGQTLEIMFTVRLLFQILTSQCPPRRPPWGRRPWRRICRCRGSWAWRSCGRAPPAQCRSQPRSRARSGSAACSSVWTTEKYLLPYTKNI